MSATTPLLPKKIFLTGATGYIGGAVLTLLLKFPEKYQISALVRQKEQGETLKSLGVTPIYGSLDSSDVLFEAAKATDVVIDCASADHLRSTQSLVNGLKAKNEKKAIFIHTSGTGVLTHDPVTTVPFDDEDIARIHAIPLQALHKEIDAWIFDNVDDITAAIIAPSTINGIGSGPFKKISQQVPGLAKVSVVNKKVGYVGPRTDTVWGNVNINDMADLFLLVLDGLIAGVIPYNKEGGFYFASHDEHQWYKVAQLMGQSLHKLGLVPTPEIAPFDEKIQNELLGPYAKYGFGHNSRAIANRSKKIGWDPKGPNVYQTLDEEMEYLVSIGELHK